MAAALRRRKTPRLRGHAQTATTVADRVIKGAVRLGKGRAAAHLAVEVLFGAARAQHDLREQKIVRMRVY